MSSDDFSTVNMRRGDRAREIEVLRQHYRDHRDQLMRLISEAPSEHLATEYQRLVRDIDGSLTKLDELEGRAPATAPTPPSAAVPVRDPVLNQKTEPGTRVLAPPPPPPRLDGGAPRAAGDATHDVTPPLQGSGSRMLLMVIVGLAVLGVIGFLIWRASRDRRTERPVIGETTTATETTRTTATAPPPILPAPGATTSAPATGDVLSVTPVVADYGTIRKGTRAVRQLEVTNMTSQPVSYAVARSQCRCLFYDYTGRLAPKKKETLTVTVDGAKAKPGSLVETIAITSKQHRSMNTSFQVNATIQ
jgi:hypothetical protein